MKMNEKKSMSGDEEEVADAMENIVIGEDGKEVDSEDVIMKYAGNPGAYNKNPPSVRGVSAGGFNKSLFKSASAAKSGSPCASHDHPKADKGPVWKEGEISEDKPDERDEKEDGQYLPPSMKMVEKDGEYKVVKKSLFMHVGQRGEQKGEGVPTKKEIKAAEREEEKGRFPSKEEQKAAFHASHLSGKPIIPRDKFKQVYGSADISDDAKARTFASMEEKLAAHEMQTEGSRYKAPVNTLVGAYQPGDKVPRTKGSETVTGRTKLPIRGESGERSKETDVKTLTRKSITELRYGSQLAHNYDIGKSCGVCGRLSKSCGDHEGGGCCEDCRKSMDSVSWHKSHLS